MILNPLFNMRSADSTGYVSKYRLRRVRASAPNIRNIGFTLNAQVIFLHPVPLLSSQSIVLFHPGKPYTHATAIPR